MEMFEHCYSRPWMLCLEEVSAHIWVATFPTEGACLGWEQEIQHMSRIWVKGQEAAFLCCKF